MTTTTAPRTCYLCEIAPAQALKIEDDVEWSDENGGAEIHIEVEHPICLACAEYWFDGTEDHPGTLPLD